MGDVHQLIMDVGVDAARMLASDKAGRLQVEAAHQMMIDERFDIGITHAGFALTGLPHKAWTERVWERTGGKDGSVTLRIESGFNRQGDMIGIPSGSLARLILFYLSSEAYANKSRIVELGSSMRAFLLRMGVSPGGKTLKLVREQVRRIALCRLTFFDESERTTLVSNAGFVTNALMSKNPDEDFLWQDTVEMNEHFYNSLLKHPLPVREAAIKQLSNRSLALDIYVYLAYRLHVLQKPTPVSWAALYGQFGAGVKEKKVFINGFKEPLALALAAYPEAKVTTSEAGVLLHPSPSPVPHDLPRVKRTSYRSKSGLTLLSGSN